LLELESQLAASVSVQKDFESMKKQSLVMSDLTLDQQREAALVSKAEGYGAVLEETKGAPLLDARIYADQVEMPPEFVDSEENHRINEPFGDDYEN